MEIPATDGSISACEYHWIISRRIKLDSENRAHKFDGIKCNSVDSWNTAESIWVLVIRMVIREAVASASG